MAAITASRHNRVLLAVVIVALALAALATLAVWAGDTGSHARIAVVGSLPDKVSIAEAAALKRAGVSGSVTVDYVQTSLSAANARFGFPGVGGADRPVWVVVAHGKFLVTLGGPPPANTCQDATCPPATPSGGPVTWDTLITIIDAEGTTSSSGSGWTDPFATLGSPSTAVVNAS